MLILANGCSHSSIYLSLWDRLPKLCISCFAVNQSIKKSATANTEILIPIWFGIWLYSFGSVLQVLTYKGTQIYMGRKAVVTFSGIPRSSSFLQGTLTISKLLIHAVSTSIRSGLYVPWKLTKFIITAEPTDLEIKMRFFSNLKEFDLIFKNWNGSRKKNWTKIMYRIYRLSIKDNKLIDFYMIMNCLIV